jgi:hypothetical protein
MNRTIEGKKADYIIEKNSERVLKRKIQGNFSGKRNYLKSKSQEAMDQRGDKNTLYFHMVAIVQKRQNTIHMLKDQHGEHTKHEKKAAILFNYFKNLIGMEETTGRHFNFQ